MDFCLCTVHTFPGSFNNVNNIDSEYLQHFSSWLYYIYVFIVVTDVLYTFICHSPIFLQHAPLSSCNATMFSTIWFCLLVVDFAIPRSYTLFVIYSSSLIILGYVYIPIDLILNFLNLFTCKGFLVKYDNISYVEYCFTSNSLHLIWSLIKYNCVLMRGVILL